MNFSFLFTLTGAQDCKDNASLLEMKSAYDCQTISQSQHHSLVSIKVKMTQMILRMISIHHQFNHTKNS